MKKLDELSYRLYGELDTIEIPNGYYTKSVPDVTRDNIKIIVDEHNKLVEAVNQIIDRLCPEGTKE